MIHRIEILGHWVLSFESFWNCKTLQVSYATLVTWSIWYCFFAVHKKVGDFPHLAADFQKKKSCGGISWRLPYHVSEAFAQLLQKLDIKCEECQLEGKAWKKWNLESKLTTMESVSDGLHENLRISDSTGSRSPTEWNGSRMWQLWTRHSHHQNESFSTWSTCLYLLCKHVQNLIYIYIDLYVYYMKCLL